MAGTEQQELVLFFITMTVKPITPDKSELGLKIRSVTYENIVSCMQSMAI